MLTVLQVAKDGKQPDWMCPDCANKNFGWREVCNRCQVGSLRHCAVHLPDCTCHMAAEITCALLHPYSVALHYIYVVYMLCSIYTHATLVAWCYNDSSCTFQQTCTHFATLRLYSDWFRMMASCLCYA